MEKFKAALIKIGLMPLGGLLAAGVGAGVTSLLSGTLSVGQFASIAIASLIALGVAGYIGWVVVIELRRQKSNALAEDLERKVRQEIADQIELDTGLVKIFPSLDDAIDEIRHEIAHSSRQYVFAQLGRELFHSSSKLNQLIFESVRPSETDLRILHASKASPYLRPSAARARGSSYGDWQIELNYMIKATPKVIDSGGKVRQHGEPFLWRLFIFDDLCFVQPYVADKNNGKIARILSFSRTQRKDGNTANEMSLYKIFEKYFLAIWAENEPRKIVVSELNNSAGRLVVAGFLRVGALTAWGIPHRYFLQDHEEVRFNGIGGKTHPGEDVLSALGREFREELAVEVQVRSSDSVTLAHEGRVIGPATCDDAIKPMLVNRFERYESEYTDYHLVAYHCSIDEIDKVVPHNDLGAVLFLTDSLLQRAAEGNLTLRDLQRANDGSKIIPNIDLAPHALKKLVPAGLAAVCASELMLMSGN